MMGNLANGNAAIGHKRAHWAEEGNGDRLLPT